MWGERTSSVLRGSMTMSFAPSRSRFLICDPTTGCASVGLQPMIKITSASATESKSCVPADVPKAWERP